MSTAILAWLTKKFGEKLTPILLVLLLTITGLLIVNTLYMSYTINTYEVSLKAEQDKTRVLAGNLELAITEVASWKGQVDSVKKSCEAQIESIKDAQSKNAQTREDFNDILEELDNAKSKTGSNSVSSKSSNGRTVIMLSDDDKRLLDRAYCRAKPKDSFCTGTSSP